MDTDDAMNSQDWYESLTDGNYNCADETRFKYWNSSTANPDVGDHDVWIVGDEALQEQVPGLASSTGFTLITTSGDPMNQDAPVSVSQPVLNALVKELGIAQYFSHMYRARAYNISHHVQYDGSSPVSIAFLFRIPRNSCSINLALHVRLADLSATCFLTATDEGLADQLHARCLRHATLVAAHPLYILALILEERFHTFKRWWAALYRGVNEIETATGMVPPLWARKLSETKAAWLASHDNQMLQLHATNTELQHCLSVLRYTIQYGEFCRNGARLLDELRPDGGRVILPQHRAAFEEHVAFFLTRTEFTLTKVQELGERLRSQINVVFSLITQRDSNVNLAIAEDSNRAATLAARDSETMKTLTLMTLLFLPASLVASLWSADIFHLDDDLNWKVYLGVTLALTATVFSLWWSYHTWYGNSRHPLKPLHISGVGYVREGRLVDKTPSVGGLPSRTGQSNMDARDNFFREQRVYFVPHMSMDEGTANRKSGKEKPSVESFDAL